jgi:hypothetical protein
MNAKLKDDSRRLGEGLEKGHPGCSNSSPWQFLPKKLHFSHARLHLLLHIAKRVFLACA